MQTSARNRFEGTVSAVRPGAVNDEIELTLAGGRRLSAVVTRESTESLGLTVGAEAVALVKAPWIVLVTDAAGYRFSARNQFAGTVTGLERGAVNTVIEVTSGDLVIAAVVTNDSVDSLGLAEGVDATAIFKRRTSSSPHARNRVRRSAKRGHPPRPARELGGALRRIRGLRRRPRLRR